MFFKYFFFLLLVLPTILHASIFKKIDSASLPTLTPEGDLHVFSKGLSIEIESCKKRQDNKKITVGKGDNQRTISIKEWCVETGEKFLELSKKATSFEELWEQAKTTFDWYQSQGENNDGNIQFTGYYSPLLHGSRTPKKGVEYPLYAKPEDLVQINGSWMMKNKNGTYEPYYDRKSIDVDFVLKNKGLELTYVDDVFEAYIFHVQGAGTVLIDEPDGSQKRIFLNYTAENGRKYASLRKVMLDHGVDPEYCTIPGMKKYFSEHPELLMPTLIENQSYVFFREDKQGPMGAADTVLIPGHAVAIDRAYYPLSALVLAKTERPILDSGSSKVTGWQPFTRFAITQDVGGAIKGPSRVDYFWGEGDYAEAAAGFMNQNGSFYIALAKSTK